MFFQKSIQNSKILLNKPLFFKNTSLNNLYQTKYTYNALQNHQSYQFCSNKYYNKYKLKYDPLQNPSYVINVDKESGLITKIEKFNEKDFDPIKIKKLREQKAKEDLLNQQNTQNQQTKDQEQQKQKQDEYNSQQNKKSYAFINDDVMHGKFPTWFVNQSLLVCINIGIYLLWKISEESEGTEMKEFLENNFTQPNTERINAMGEKVETKIFPNIILSGFSHQCFAHLLCNTGILLIFARRLTEYLGPYKFWGLYLGSLIGGYLINSVNTSLEPQQMKQDNMIRRLNIMRGQNTGYQNLRSDGGSDAIQALVAFTYCSLANVSFIFPQHLHYFALLVLPTYFLEDLFNWFYGKKDTWQYQINKPHIGGFLFGIMFYFANEIGQKQLKGNIDKKKLSIMFLSLWVYTIFYWYLNEKEYWGTRRVQNKLGKQHELIIKYYDYEVDTIINNIQDRYIQNLDVNKFKSCLQNLEDSQIKYGDKPFYELHRIITEVQQPEDRYYIIKQLEKNYQLKFLDFKQAKKQRSRDFFNAV